MGRVPGNAPSRAAAFCDGHNHRVIAGRQEEGVMMGRAEDGDDGGGGRPSPAVAVAPAIAAAATVAAVATRCAYGLRNHTKYLRSPPNHQTIIRPPLDRHPTDAPPHRRQSPNHRPSPNRTVPPLSTDALHVEWCRQPMKACCTISTTVYRATGGMTRRW